MLSNRLRLAAYKISTQQIHTPFPELATLPIDPSDTVSQAIQRFRESKRIQDQREYYSKRRLSVICRREARRTRRAKSTNPIITLTSTSAAIPMNFTLKSGLARQPSTIPEVPSDQERTGMLSPPDSQPSKTPSSDIPCTPAPKRRIRRVKKARVYNEYNGDLGLSSPPQQAYDPQDVQQDWYMDEIEVGDVPSSVLRGVEGLWALGN